MLLCGTGVLHKKQCLKIVCGVLISDIVCLMVNLFLEQLNGAVNAVIADSAGAARLLLAAQQLNQCLENANPHSPRNQWIPGMINQNLQWAPNPCQPEQEAVDQLTQQSAVEGNQTATQQLGGAPAPQLATAGDPVPSQDPAIPASEFEPGNPGASSPWEPVLPEDVMMMLADRLEDLEDQDMIDLDNILDSMKYYQLWCPWGGPSVKNLKWTYKPKNRNWLGKWTPR